MPYISVGSGTIWVQFAPPVILNSWICALIAENKFILGTAFPLC